MKSKILFLILLGLGFFQVAFLGRFRIFGIQPDLLLISVVWFSMHTQLKQAITLSISVGVAKDIFGIYPVGINMLLFPLWSFLIIRLSREISIDNGPIRLVVVYAVSFLNAIATRLVFLFLANNIPLGLFLRNAFLEPLYTALAALLVFRALGPALVRRW
jgi:rod shape-determining protein MreD